MIIFADMVLESISSDVSSCPNPSQSRTDLSGFPNVLDGILDTCDVISGPDIIHMEVRWRFPGHKSGLNRFRVVLSGTQNCSDSNTVWFVSTDTPVNFTECRVSQDTTGELMECLITCTCPCAECEYLHFRVQMPAWMRRTLAICHSELLNEYDTVELPFVVVWALTEYRQVSNIRRTEFQHLKDSRTVLRLSLPNPLKPDVKSRMKM